MYWFKKICRAILNLLPVFLLLFVFSSPVSALKHEYDGIPFFAIGIPCPSLDETAGEYYLDYNTLSDCQSFDGGGPSIEFEGSAYNSMYDNLSMSINQSQLSLSYDSEENQFGYSDVHSIFINEGDNDSSTDEKLIRTSHYNQAYYNLEDVSFLNNFDLIRYTFTPFGQSGFPPFSAPFIDGFISCDSFSNGANCPALWAAKMYVNSQILPYSFTADGFYRHGSAIDTDSGVHYGYTFDFADMFNVDYIPSFSKLSIPLHSYNGYFHDSNNFPVNRHLEFRGAFQFDGTFDWNENMGENNYFRLRYSGFTKYSTTPVDEYVDCQTTLTTASTPDQTYRTLEFSCPLDLNSDYLSFSPFIEISGDGQAVWFTDSNWRFASMFLVTDYDETPGESFNSNLHAKNQMNLIGSEEYILNKAKEENNGSDIDFFASLTNMFNFMFINPFLPLYDSFVNSDSCASIPTLASMIHSNETQVCPWFDSTTRSIVTPVIGLSSMMLLFGFAVRWLKSSSGNLFEDSSNEYVSGMGGSWRRYKN